MGWFGEALRGRRVLALGLAFLAAFTGARPALAQGPAHTSKSLAVEREPPCPPLFGARWGALGPNSLTTLAGVVQPGVCWLELSVAFGFGAGEISGYDEYNDGADTTDMTGEGNYLSLTAPVGARVWFMSKHSLLADAGFGFTRYNMYAHVDTNFGNDGRWTRLTTPLITYAGVGYGYRRNEAQAGPRLSIVLGVLVHLTDLADSTMLGAVDPPEVAGIKQDLDDETDELADLEPYAEISVSWMF